MTFKPHLLTLFFTILLLGGCGSPGVEVEPPPPQPDPTPPPAVVTLGQPFTVPIGGRVALPDNITFEFSEVTNDSRCPLEVECVWAGEAEVHGRLIKNNATLDTFNLVVSGVGNTAEYEGASQAVAIYQVVVLSLAPHAQIDVDLSDQYVATFQINSLDS